MSTCEETKLSLGAYALGALDPEEEQSVQEHLVRCPACTAEVAELSGTVDLLALVDPNDLADLERRPPRSPSEDLLPRMLQRVAAERRRRRWFSALSVAAAVAVMVAGAVAVGAREPGRAPVAGPTTTPSVTGPGTPSGSVSVLTATDTDTGVTLRLETTPQGWGTALHLELGGVPGGLRCSLVAVAADGSREVAATWAVPADGYGGPDSGSRLVIDGAVGFAPDQVRAYEVVTTDGRTLVTAPA